MRKILWIAVAASLPIATVVSASDRVQVAPAPGIAGNVETIAVEIRAEDGVILSGTLTLGPRYDSASFSQSKSETIAPCDGAPIDPNRSTNVNSSLNLSLSRTSWQQTPDRFTINFNRSVALPACEGQGSNNSGFNRMVDIVPGGSSTIQDNSGAAVTISRR